ncbi:hypothetical protein [Methylobacterium sp. Leaf85]|uniref:hypothetical protein n=1 Tax=Methylobacterium sp. Leaf85 TaxID=1736241 RepID=UPI0012E8488B|nr:hypothetical protein [Methylobacterium sp. Leaf85]
MPSRDPHLAAARIVQDAGGELVGRTRLQKIAFLTQLAGFGDEFAFEYRHYGPYSEELAQAMEIAVVLGPVVEEERVADWGGRYSIYTVAGSDNDSDQDRKNFIQEAKRIDAVELELAATAAYFYVIEGIGDKVEGNPWEETRRRKPSKATGQRLDRAFRAYEELRKMKTLSPLPYISIG